MSPAPPRSHTGDRTALIVAAVVAVGIVAAAWFAFAKGLPFGSHSEITAVFARVNQLEKGDEVRVAGLRVGKVQRVGRGPDGMSLVTLRLDDDSLVIHRDATLRIEPRLVLEGNDQVVMTLGSPSAPRLGSGDRIPAGQTSSAVQLDQVLGVLTRPTREALKSTVRNLARGLGPAPSGNPGASGTHGLRQASDELDRTLDSVRDVASAARGTTTGDLTRAARSTGDVTAQLAQDPRALADMVTNFRRVTGALAARDQDLAASVRGFDALTREAPADLQRVDAALPLLTSFARSLRPALRTAPGPLHRFGDLLVQLRGLGRPAELPRLVASLSPITGKLPSLQRELQQTLPLIDDAAVCVERVVVPTLDTKIQDGPLSSGRPVWQDLFHLAANLAGTAAGFDGNGTTIRLGITESEQALTGVLPGLGRVAGLGPEIEGIRPVWLGYGKNPPFRPDAKCREQELPDLTKRSGAPMGNLRSVERPPLSASSRRIMKALLGGPDDRRALLTRLLRQLKLDGGVRRSPTPERRLPVKPVLPRPTSPAGKPAKSILPTLEDDVVQPIKDVTDAVGAIVGGLLKGGRTP